MCIFCLLFFIPLHIIAILSLPLPAETQIRGRSAGPPPPSPTLRHVPYIFFARRIQPFLLLSTQVQL